MMFAVRISTEGLVCFGYYLKDNDPLYKGHEDYFMRYEGRFIIFVLVYVIMTVLIFICLHWKINQKDYKKYSIKKTLRDSSQFKEHSDAV